MASPNEHGKSLSPRKGLQGTRPTHLKVGNSSSKHQKQPLNNHGHAPPSYRPPVIIYMKSPEVIHVEPQNFMNTVQHLTGNSSSTSLPSPLPSSGDGVDCTSIVGSSGKTGEEPQQQSDADVEDMLLLQNMSSWEPSCVPWPPTSSPTPLFPSPNVYPDFYDFDMMSSTPGPDYQDSNHGSTS